MLSNAKNKIKAGRRIIDRPITIAAALGTFGMILTGSAVAQTSGICKLPPATYIILKNQTYALCAGLQPSFLIELSMQNAR